LAVLLTDPQRWHEVQQHVLPQQFTDDTRKRLAEFYWHFQRDVGEPVFNEFLGELKNPDLTELAVELVDEIEGLDPKILVDEALAHFAELHRRLSEQKTLAALSRTKDQRVSEEDEVALLRQLAQKNKPDLHRLGPVRRTGQ
jgi:hypothetical protein